MSGQTGWTVAQWEAWFDTLVPSFTEAVSAIARVLRQPDSTLGERIGMAAVLDVVVHLVNQAKDRAEQP